MVLSAPSSVLSGRSASLDPGNEMNENEAWS